MPYDERRGGCFCPSHPHICATGGFIVQFGRDILKRFPDIRSAERFLNLCRAETDAQKFDPRDYKPQNPLGLVALSQKWLAAKENSGIRPSTVVQYRYFIGLAIAQWGDANIKSIAEPEIEDFLLGAILKKDGNPITSKTRANLKSALHDFWAWVIRREGPRTPGLRMPVFPEIRVEMAMRAIVGLDTQLAILDEIRHISWHVNPRIWIGCYTLATYPAIRPRELISVRERDINREIGSITIPSPKERRPKTITLHEDDFQHYLDLPRCLNPDMPFFRHIATSRGRHKAGAQFGPKYLGIWWNRACQNLGIEGVTLYPGTKHSTVTGVGELLSPEQIRRGGTEHRTSRAFERYMIPQNRERLVFREALAELRERNTDAIPNKKAKVVNIK